MKPKADQPKGEPTQLVRCSGGSPIQIHWSDGEDGMARLFVASMCPHCLAVYLGRTLDLKPNDAVVATHVPLGGELALVDADSGNKIGAFPLSMPAVEIRVTDGLRRRIMELEFAIARELGKR